jgi:hypothetical protein
LGVAATFFGVVFIIVGWKGGGTEHMQQNLLGMMKGQYLPADNPQNSGGVSTKSTPATSTTGGVHAPPSAIHPGTSNK